jgi:hypothetical protein
MRSLCLLAEWIASTGFAAILSLDLLERRGRSISIFDAARCAFRPPE